MWTLSPPTSRSHLQDLVQENDQRQARRNQRQRRRVRKRQRRRRRSRKRRSIVETAAATAIAYIHTRTRLDFCFGGVQVGWVKSVVSVRRFQRNRYSRGAHSNKHYSHRNLFPPESSSEESMEDFRNDLDERWASRNLGPSSDVNNSTHNIPPTVM